jgi:hypothetical protein
MDDHYKPRKDLEAGAGVTGVNVTSREAYAGPTIVSPEDREHIRALVA